jgi:hypothetical protein
MAHRTPEQMKAELQQLIHCVSEDKDTEPTEWEHEVMGISKETPFNRFTMRFQVVNNSVQICVYDMDDLLLTIDLDTNERVKLKTPCFVEPGETQFILSAFETVSEAETCLLILEARQDGQDTFNLN